MWETMVRVANDFYAWGDLADEVLKVLFAWAIMLLPAIIILRLGLVAIEVLIDVIRDKIKYRGTQ